jgi:hypothetical protein
LGLIRLGSGLGGFFSLLAAYLTAHFTLSTFVDA